jgi:hypothetical protein
MNKIKQVEGSEIEKDKAWVKELLVKAPSEVLKSCLKGSSTTHEIRKESVTSRGLRSLSTNVLVMQNNLRTDGPSSSLYE